MDAGAYRSEAEAFVSALDLEYYLHFSGQREQFDVEPIYGRHARLFERHAVEELRAGGEEGLLEFAVHGLIGRATADETAELARREAALELELEEERLPFRQAGVAQANEPDPERRAELEAARLALSGRELQPLLLEIHERTSELVRSLGWDSVRAMVEELSGIDLGALGRRTGAFLDATRDDFQETLDPELRRQLGLGLERLRRSDLPAFFRAPSLDALFPEDRRDAALAGTCEGLGMALGSLPNVILDAASRPTKSARAFCAPVRVPAEVYLVISPSGGRDDYEALFHECGHALHYAHVDPALPFEHRYLGDNSVTECFAFLFQHLTSDPAWLERVLGIEEPSPVVSYARAAKLLFLRRYCGKLAYELELHAPGTLRGTGVRLEDMPGRYAELLSDATGVEWPAATWLSDVDEFFYAARYLRAWAVEASLRRRLRERFGDTWFSEPEAGAALRELWREGQRQDAEALLEGEEISFGALLADVQAKAPPGQGMPA